MLLWQRRGLNAHKRSCYIFDISEISDLITETVEENNLGSEVEMGIETVPKNLLKPGIKLPKNDKVWEQATDFLRNNLHGNLENSNVNSEIINFQSIIYDFCSSWSLKRRQFITSSVQFGHQYTY